MLFSNDDVARFINANFEPAWQSLRPVPLVTIDFGNGRVVRRTLHGNVATHLCLSDGRVLDILPGIYDPASYLDRLEQMTLLHRYVEQFGANSQQEYLRHYHETQLAAVREGDGFPRLVEEAPFRSILAVERPLRIVLQPAARIQARAALVRPAAKKAFRTATPVSSSELAEWQALAEDTRINESTRRTLIHERLASTGAVSTGELTKWLYREVLHADLDDPYLGLSPLLFGSYPFADEDAFGATPEG